MGCGHSKSAVKSPSDIRQAEHGKAVIATEPRVEATDAPQAQHGKASQKILDSAVTNSTLDTQTTSSRETTPNPTSVRKTNSRFIEDQQTLLESPETQNLSGPKQNYTGLPLQKEENTKLTHITTLARTILKASCVLVILGTQSKMLLVNFLGLAAEDDTWLPAFCAWALNQEAQTLTIENMHENDLSKDLEWVKHEPRIGFYTGLAVHAENGERLGILCVFDFDPIPGSTALCLALPSLAEMVARELKIFNPKDNMERLLYRGMDTYWDGSVLVDTRVGRWRIQYVNETFCNMTGIERSTAIGKDLWDMVAVEGNSAANPWENCEEKISSRQRFKYQPVISLIPTSRQSSGSRRSSKYVIEMWPMTEEVMTNYGLEPKQEDIVGKYFAVFTHLQPNSRGGLTQEPTVNSGDIPIEGLIMGPIIGKGSFGSVFKAAWGGKIVAVKIIELGASLRKDASGDLLEASLMLEMKHPNIVETIQHVTHEHMKDTPLLEATAQLPGHPTGSASSIASRKSETCKVTEFWLLLEYCDLGTLSDGANTGLFHKEVEAKEAGVSSRLPINTVIIATARDIAAGLHHIHSHNILHGDLTAGNVLLATAKTDPMKPFVAKIADFGLSRQTISSKVETNTYGTVTHMPPELLNEGILSKAADVYAYGVLLYEIYTGEQVWQGLRHPQIIHAIAVLKKHPELPETAPKAFRDLAHSCMTAEPEKRPDFATVIKILDSIQEP